MTTKISLCMIAKNEEQNIGRCLQSVIGVVDEIIVVDTGSSDTTCQIAQGFGAKVQSFMWNDNFSDARNASLDLATGDWILFLDADEELATDSGPILHSAVLEPDMEGYFIKIVNVSGDDSFPERSGDMVFRLFRNKPSYRFQGAVHEQICDVISENNGGSHYRFIEDVVIYHYGYLSSQLETKDKKNRNRVLLEKELINKPDDLLVRFHYGVELYRMEEYLPAAQEFEKLSTKVKPETVIYGPKLMRYIVLAYYRVQELKAALHALQRGLAMFPDYADLYHFGGIIYYQLREYGLAYDYLQKALQAPKQPVHYASFYGLQGYRSYYYLGQIAEKFCNEEAALGYYIDSLRDNSNFTAALNRIIPILQPRCDPDYAHYAINKICDLALPQAKLLIAELLFNHSAYAAALVYFEGVSHEVFTPQFILHKAICLIQQRRSGEAIDLLDFISEKDDVAYYAQLNKLLCFWFEGNQQKVRTAGEELLTLGLSEDTVPVIELLMNTDSKQNTLQSIGSEGIRLLLEILKRTLDLGDIEGCRLLLSGVTSQSIVDYYLPLGELFYQYGHFSLAEEYLNQHMEQNSEDAVAYFILAEMKAGQELYVDAIDYYQQALHCDPKEPSYYIKLIQAYDKVRSALLKQAVEKYPEFPIIGTLLEEAGTER